MRGGRPSPREPPEPRDGEVVVERQHGAAARGLDHGETDGIGIGDHLIVELREPCARAGVALRGGVLDAERRTALDRSRSGSLRGDRSARRKDPAAVLRPYFSTVIKWNGDVIPCCTHRHGMQYVPGADARVFGNVFVKDFADIWNSPEYQRARRLVSDPTRSGAEPELSVISATRVLSCSRPPTTRRPAGGTKWTSKRSSR